MLTDWTSNVASLCFNNPCIFYQDLVNLRQILTHISSVSVSSKKYCRKLHLKLFHPTSHIHQCWRTACLKSFVRNKREASFRDKRNNKKNAKSLLEQVCGKRQNKKLMIRKRTRQIIGHESLCTSDFEFSSLCYGDKSSFRTSKHKKRTLTCHCLLWFCSYLLRRVSREN